MVIILTCVGDTKADTLMSIVVGSLTFNSEVVYAVSFVPVLTFPMDSAHYNIMIQIASH